MKPIKTTFGQGRSLKARRREPSLQDRLRIEHEEIAANQRRLKAEFYERTAPKWLES